MNLSITHSGSGTIGAAPFVPYTKFLGLPFNLLRQEAVLRLIIGRSGAPYRYVITPNASHVVAAHEEPARWLPIYQGAWLSLCDSRIIRALARLDGCTLPLVTGSDLVAALLARLNAYDGRARRQHVLLVGSSPSAEAALRKAYPRLSFEIMAAPAGLAQNADLRLAVARACLTRHWDIALLCVGCPAQELIAQQLAELGCKSGIALCVGASIDFLTGVRRRAPSWLQRLSLEWAYRLAQEPGRLWRRYLIVSPRILRVFLQTRSVTGR
jgi:N-acetylglucosaminyldiphosphoundecaprenol N-acetyl-beta-D-mannosaminyltransferase